MRPAAYHHCRRCRRRRLLSTTSLTRQTQQTLVSPLAASVIPAVREFKTVLTV